MLGSRSFLEPEPTEENKKNVAKYYRVALFKKFWVNKIIGTWLA